MRFTLTRTTVALGVSALLLAGGVATAGMITVAPTPATAAQSADARAEISVYSREEGSGTRGAFAELLGLEEKLPSGAKVDTISLDAAITNSTAVMMTSVSSDPNAIGYVSLGSLNDSVKAVKVDSVTASAETIKDGTYTLARPFIVVTTDDLTPEARDFMDFILSADGQTVIEDNGYIAVADKAKPYKAANTEGKIVVAGSSSVTPVMEKLAEAYAALNPKASVEVQQSDSTTGVSMALEGTCNIGMASRALKDSEVKDGAQSTEIAQDGIAVIVSPSSSVEDLTSDQIRQIFAGETTSWQDVQ